MFKRVFFTLQMAWRYRQSLKAYVHDSTLQLGDICDLEVLRLKAQGIQALVLDFDGVLATHGETVPDLRLSDWLNLCVRTLGEGHVFILTNKPTQARERYFLKHFPGIVFIQANRKKPYPDGLLQVMQDTRMDAQALLVVDDRLLTGILAAVLVGAKGLWVINPRISFRKRPLIESFFWVLRKGEYWLVSILP